MVRLDNGRVVIECDQCGARLGEFIMANISKFQRASFLCEDCARKNTEQSSETATHDANLLTLAGLLTDLLKRTTESDPSVATAEASVKLTREIVRLYGALESRKIADAATEERKQAAQFQDAHRNELLTRIIYATQAFMSAPQADPDRTEAEA